MEKQMQFFTREIDGVWIGFLMLDEGPKPIAKGETKDECIANMDSWIADVVDQLRESGALEKIQIQVISPNGVTVEGNPGEA